MLVFVFWKGYLINSERDRCERVKLLAVILHRRVATGKVKDDEGLSKKVETSDWGMGYEFGDI